MDDDEKSQVLVKVEDETQQMFALRYLKDFSKASSLCETVTLQMSPNVPLAVGFKIEDLGDLCFFLAPKIEEDE